MKISKFIAIVFLAVFTFSACKTETKKVQKETKEAKAENLQKMAFNISGMTCEIGCAKTIQSKLSKKAGIASAKVIFKDSLGLVEFDANAISKEDITAFVNGIAGGGMYKVNNAKSVTTFDEVAK
jgi:copper chaperone CopZ